MANAVAIIEREFNHDHMPTLANILMQTPGIPAASFAAGFMECIRKTPALIQCTRESLFMCASSFSFIGVMPGSFTGQAYMLPFKDRKAGVTNAVPVIGYKGYNTVAARSKIFIEGSTIRKDDIIKIVKGSHPRIHHEPNLEKSDAQIIGAWSCLVRDNSELRFSQTSLGIKQLLQIKAKSMGSRKEDSPWNDHAGPGFDAMCEKSVRRRQARSIPLNAFLMADAVETMHDLGTPAWIIPSENDGAPQLMTPTGVQHPPPPEKSEIVIPPKNLKIIAITGLGKKNQVECKDVGHWLTVMLRMIRQTKPASISATRKANSEIMRQLEEAGFDGEVHEAMDAMNERESAK